MAYECRVECDSISPEGSRLTTFVVTYPRFILAEMNTHRALCLAGDSVLEFDLPSGSHKRPHRVYKMRIDEFVDKWHNGARRFGANPKKDYDLSWVVDGEVYTPLEAAAKMGMASQAPINSACRDGEIKVITRSLFKGQSWSFTGKSLKAWRQRCPEHTRFDMRAKLARMRIRQLNEETGDIQWSNVVDCWFSGVKKTYTVTAGDYVVSGSADHLVMTAAGWKRIGELTVGDLLVVQKMGKREEDRKDPMRLRKIGGVWRNTWQNAQRTKLASENPLCRRCGVNPGVQVHHVVPVYIDPSRAFDESNITLLCEPCHYQEHSKQGWQTGMCLYGSTAPVERVELRGEEPTYDLSIAGEFPNFIANGVVVHNSRNAASSRAIPVARRIQAVVDDPFVPEQFGKNQKGMQSGEALAGGESLEAERLWRSAMEGALVHARYLSEIGVHKQLANRLLEPFSWVTQVITATDWNNFFALRCHKDAQPEFQKIARMMRAARDASRPVEFEPDWWHLPFVRPEELAEVCAGGDPARERYKLVSAGRCARVSYLTHDGRRDCLEDIRLANELIHHKPAHSSPLEHQAFPCPGRHGNLNGWKSFRMTLADEHVPG